MKNGVAVCALISCLVAAGCRSEGREVRADQLPANALADPAPDPSADSGAQQARAVPVRVRVSDYVDVYASSISPDGRYVTEIDWSTGDLAVRNLVTESLHRLTDKGTWRRSGDYAQTARFDGSGRRLAYQWYDAETANYEIRVLDFSIDDDGIPRGSSPSVLLPAGTPNNAGAVYGWMSDDDILIGLYRPDNTRALAYLSISTGSLRVLESFTWPNPPGNAVISPDRAYIAFDQDRGPGQSNGSDIWLLSAHGREEARLIDAAGNDEVLGWMADGGLLYHNDRSGNGSIWRLPMAGGRAAGPPVLVLEDITDPVPVGVAGNALYYGLRVDAPAYATATVDFAGHRLVPRTTRFEAPLGGRILGLAWSHDGQHVVYRADHPATAGAWIHLRTTDGQPVRDWHFPIGIMRTELRWTPDGSGVVVPARDHFDRPGFIRIDLQNGTTRMIRRFDPAGEAFRFFTISPDGHLYFTLQRMRDGVQDERFADVVALDLETGEEHAVRRVAGHGKPSVSPDGQWLALAMETREGARAIRVFPPNGGDARTVYRAGDPIDPVSGPEQPLTGTFVPCGCAVLGWSADSRWLLFHDEDRVHDNVTTLFRVSRDGGAVERIATITDYMGGATLRPDGRTIAYRTGEWRGEIWTLEMPGIGGSGSEGEL